jgi:site-specific DNA recombinase
MTPDPFEAGLIAQAVDLLLDGESLNGIAYGWNENGVPRPQATESGWSAHGIHAVVSNPRHAGLIAHDPKRGTGAYSRTIVGEAQWPAIVERTKWKEVLALLDSRGRSQNVPRRRSLLTGLLVCSLCSTTMVRSTDGTNKIWRCPSANPQYPNSCGKVSVSATHIEAFLTEKTFYLAEETDRLEQIVQAKASEGANVRSIVLEMEASEKRLDDAAEMFGAGTISARQFETVSATIEQRQENLRRDLAKMTRSSVLAPYVQGKKGVMRAMWPTRSTDQRREIIKTLLGRVTVAPTAMRGRHVFDSDRVRIAA